MKKGVWLRPSIRFFSSLVLLIAGTCICYAHSIYSRGLESRNMPVKIATLALLGAPDLGISTAARYVRHASLTDVSTAFQDCPGCLDYFPEVLTANPPPYFGIVTRFEQEEP